MNENKLKIRRKFKYSEVSFRQKIYIPDLCKPGDL